METDSVVRSGQSLAAVLARRWYVLLVVAALFGAAGFALSSSRPTLYSSSATMLLNDPSNSSVFNENNRTVVDPSRYVRGQARFLTSTPVLMQAAATLRGRVPLAVLRTRVTATASDELNEVSVTALDPSAAGAAEVANAVADAYQQAVRRSGQEGAAATTRELDQTIADLRARIMDLDKQLSDRTETDPSVSAARQAAATQLLSVQSRVDEIAVDTATYGDGVQMFEPADPPAGPAQPKPLGATAVGGFLGLLLAGALVWWRGEYRRRADEKQDPAAVLGVPLLGDVPEFASVGGTRAVPAAYEPTSAAGEAYNFLVESIGFAMQAEGGSVIAVTSPGPGDGKTVTTLNLSIAMARDDRRVAVVDGDERMRGLTRLAEVEDRPGLSDLGQESVPIAAAIRSLDIVGTDGLDVVPAGSDVTDPAGFFRTSGFRRALGRLRENVDIVIVDSPPLLAVSDAAAIASQADAVVLVIGRGTPLRVLVEVRHRLEFIGTPVLGYVFNRSTVSGRYGRYGQYGYGRSYGYGRTAPAATPAIPRQRRRGAAENPAGQTDSARQPGPEGAAPRSKV